MAMGTTTSEGDVFDPDALWVARLFRGLSVAELAEQSSLSREAIHRIEHRKKQPFRLSVMAIADALGFPLRFFYRRPSVPSREVLHFRRGARVPDYAIDRARAFAAVFGRVTEAFNSLATFASPRLPAVDAPRDNESIEKAAEKFRAAIGFRQDTPIANAIRAAELAGVFTGTFDPGDMPIHGFASNVPMPLLMLSTKSPWSRRRFSVMHEVGHLVMHGKAAPEEREERERQADRFAGAALIPRAAFWREFPRPGKEFGWGAIIAMKRRWGVSIQAIIHRAFDLGLINAIQYRTASIHVSKYGWRTAEPGEQEAEKPDVCMSFVEALRQRSAIEDLCATSDLTLEVIGLVLGVHLEDTTGQSEIIKLGSREPRNDPT
jgi:Zn-dependent peptidase ImmA (M78 family)/transcriptional regulator with XRE-family HTH domain